MTVNAIVSMAMLKVNADSVGMSVLENFQPFVLDRLYHSGTEAVSAPDLRSAISTEYGVDIPTAVIQTLTKRIARDGLLTRDYGILKFIVRISPSTIWRPRGKQLSRTTRC